MKTHFWDIKTDKCVWGGGGTSGTPRKHAYGHYIKSFIRPKHKSSFNETKPRHLSGSARYQNNKQLTVRLIKSNFTEFESSVSILSVRQSTLFWLLDREDGSTTLLRNLTIYQSKWRRFTENLNLHQYRC
jgi:hypothetical protein